MNDELKEYYQSIVEEKVLDEEKTNIINSLIENDDVFLYKFKDQLSLKIDEHINIAGKSYKYHAIKIGTLDAFLIFEGDENTGLLIAQEDEFGWRFIFPENTNSLLHNLYWQKK